MNVFYVRITHTATITVADLKNLADAISTSHPVTTSTTISSSTSLTAVRVDFIPTAGNVLSYTGSYSIVGTGGTGVADAAACYVIDWVISARYRGGHPRMYVPGLPASAVTNGSDISAGNMTTVIASATTLRTTVNALASGNITAAEIGTVAFQRSDVWLSPPDFQPFTSAKAGNGSKVGSQRRRIKS